MAGDAKRRVPIHYKEEGEGMQIEEKLEVFRNFTIEVARKESEQQMAEYEASCHQEVEMFRQQKLAEMEHKIRNASQAPVLMNPQNRQFPVMITADKDIPVGGVDKQIAAPHPLG